MPASFLYMRKIVLEGDGGQGLVFIFDLDSFLGLQGLVQTVGIAAARHEAAGELVHDDDLAFFDDVVHVPLEEVMGLAGPAGGGAGLRYCRVIKIFQAHQFLGPRHSIFGNEHRAGLLVHGEVLVRP